MASFFKRTRTRKDGSTYERWVGEFNYNGKTKTVTGKTKGECEEKIREFTTDKITYGVELKKTSYTLSKLLYDHLFTNVHPNVAASTFDRYMCLYNKHIKETSFGDTNIVDIRQKDIQQWFNQKNDISTKALAMVRYLLKQSFDFAINNNYIRVNPVISIKLPKNDTAEKREIEILSVTEQEAYMNSLDKTKYKLLYLTALFTGMRRGEILALKWDNVDLKNKILTVKESRKRYKKYNTDGSSENMITDKAPKTKNSIRTIPIPDFLNKLLIKHKLEQDNDANNNNLVFINSSGEAIQPEYLRLMQISICKRANIRYVSFHALRHTFATRLIENGVDIKTVSKLLGHSDVIITLNTYVHETLESKRSATDVLANQFKEVMSAN